MVDFWPGSAIVIFVLVLLADMLYAADSLEGNTENWNTGVLIAVNALALLLYLVLLFQGLA